MIWEDLAIPRTAKPGCPSDSQSQYSQLSDEDECFRGLHAASFLGDKTILKGFLRISF